MHAMRIPMPAAGQLHAFLLCTENNSLHVHGVDNLFAAVKGRAAGGTYGSHIHWHPGRV